MKVTALAVFIDVHCILCYVGPCPHCKDCFQVLGREDENCRCTE